jgi:hypothetical protein
VGGIEMMQDFMMGKYQELCQTLLDCDYSIVPVFDWLKQRGAGQHDAGMVTDHAVAVVRHDVDRRPGNALKMAELEYVMGICSTYYFRYPSTFKPEIIRHIQGLGHEIGYHYEVLSKAKGDPERAIHLFEQELRAMREVCDIRTICMHGSPLSRYDNRDLWNHYDLQDFGVDGEAYLSLQDAGLRYFTDTGRNWCGKHSVRDVMPGSSPALSYVETTDDLIDWIRSSGEEGLYLTVHPERWALDEREWTAGYVKDLVVNAGKRVLLGVR